MGFMRSHLFEAANVLLDIGVYVVDVEGVGKKAFGQA